MVNFFSVAHFDKVLLSSTQFVISIKFHASNHFAEHTILELVQCENLAIFLSLRFYVKSALNQTQPICFWSRNLAENVTASGVP